MTKSHLISSLKPVLIDRPMAVALIIFLLLCLAYGSYVLLSLQPTDLQVAVHYTAFGDTNFYRARWYYLLSFVGFGVMVAVLHTILAVKIHAQDRRQLALGFTWLSSFIIVVTWLITYAVLGVAFPS